MRISPSANGAYRMSHNEPPSHLPLGESRPDNFLDSWKSLLILRGRYGLSRGGKRRKAPVHRQIHEKLGTVYAFKSEIDAWWRERSAKLASKPENGEIAGGRALSHGLQGRRKHQMRNSTPRLDRVGRGAWLQS